MGHRAGIALGVTSLLGLGWLLAADPPAEDKPVPVKPLQEWRGSVETEALAKIAPPVITTSEGWSILWKAWQGAAEIPKVDFQSSIVAVHTTRGSRIKPSLQQRTAI